MLTFSRWWYTYTPLKNMSSSVGMIIPNIWKNKKCSKPPTSSHHQYKSISPSLLRRNAVEKVNPSGNGTSKNRSDQKTHLKNTPPFSPKKKSNPIEPIRKKTQHFALQWNPINHHESPIAIPFLSTSLVRPIRKNKLYPN